MGAEGCTPTGQPCRPMNSLTPRDLFPDIQPLVVQKVKQFNEATSQRSNAPHSHTSSRFTQDRTGQWLTSSSGWFHQLHRFTSEPHTHTHNMAGGCPDHTPFLHAQLPHRSPAFPPRAESSAALSAPADSSTGWLLRWGGCCPHSSPHPQSSPHRKAVLPVLAGQEEGEAALFLPPPPVRHIHPQQLG